MSEWVVYGKDGLTEKCRLKSVEYSGSFLNERAVSATIENHSKIQFEVFDYIEYRGERFELESIPTVKKTSSFSYEYELRFVSYKYELERCEMRDIVPNDNRVVYPTPLTFSFTGDVRYLVERIQACLDELYGKDVWKLSVADDVVSEEKNITIAQQNCWNALALVNTTYGLNFYIKGRNITIGGSQPILRHTFQYGKGNGLYEIERTSDTDTAIVTKLRAYGSEKNLDYSYPKKPEWSDSALDTSFVLSPLRLMLPSFKKDGKTDYILADEATIAEYGIREASVIYDDIYPTITGAKNLQGQAIDEIKAVEAVDDTKSTFVVYLHDLGFDLESHLTTADAQISMKSGAMQGYTFNISAIEKQEDNSYKITLGRITTDTSDTGNYEIPNSSWNIAAGDKFVLLNILMPQKYIREAENRLLERAKEYLAEYSKTNFSYNVGLHDKFLVENSDVYSSLVEGAKLTIHDEVLGISEDVTIQSITITEDAEDNILPQVKITLNNNPSASTLDRIQGQIKELSETASGTFSSQSELLKQYRKKLDKPFFDRLFVAVGLDGKELASTDTTSPIAYIKAKYSFATIGGITMYAQDGNMDIPTIAEGLPFDNRTIWFNPTTGQIEVIGGTGGGEGVSNFWDLSGIPSWITNAKPTYSYSEIQGTPDLSKYALLSDIPSLSGYATEQWVLGKGYALASDLSKYIPIAGATEITGEKNFIGGLKVNGSPIYYDTDKKYWKLEGDLLVTGGVTMYGNDSEFIPSTIMDAILYDDTTLGINAKGELYVKGGTGGGVADSVAWGNVLGKPYWITDSAPIIGISGVNVSLGGSITQSALRTALGLGSNAYSSTAYLPLTGGTLTGSLEIKTNSSYVHFKDANGKDRGSLGVLEDNNASVWKPSKGWKTLLDADNYSSYALPLTGGTLTNTLTIDNSTVGLILHRSGQATPYIRFGQDANNEWGELGVYNDGRLVFCPRVSSQGGYGQWNTVWHSGNDGSGSGLDADLLDGLNSSAFFCDKGASNSFDNKIYNGAYRTSSFKPNDAYGYGLVASFRSMETCAQIYFPDNNGEPRFRMQWNSQTSISIGWQNLITSSSIGNYNAGSATKLQTARTIWGQSFDGTSDISGSLVIDNPYITWGSLRVGGASYFGNQVYLFDNVSNDANNNSSRLYFAASGYDKGVFLQGINVASYGRKRLGVFVNNEESYSATTWIEALSVLPNGNVGIGTTSPSFKLHVTGSVLSNGYYTVGGIYGWNADTSFTSNNRWGMYQWGNLLQITQRDVHNNFISSPISIDLSNGMVAILKLQPSCALDVSGDILASGGITMYSDIRKKTILNHVELSLQQVANAPLIEHYYNSDQNKTTHVGSIAQYWAEMNDWFCKEDNEGFLTMEIQNCALASAISIARELVKFETETDRRIRLLEEENKRLKEEVEQLKWNIA